MHQGGRKRLAACLLAAAAASAAETVVLRNGFRLEGERLVPGPEHAKLLLANGGWIAVPVEEVLRVEQEDTGRTGAARDSQPQPEPRQADSLDARIAGIADEAGLPRDLLRAVVWAESGFRPDAVSPKGALGLMQLMPGTAAELGVDPSDPTDNLRGGSRYLGQLLDRFEGRRDQLTRALAAYNAGPARVDEHGGIPPYDETVAYVAKVVRRFLSDSTGRAARADRAPDETGTVNGRAVGRQLPSSLPGTRGGSAPSVREQRR